MNLMMLIFIDRKLWPNLALHSLQFPYPKATILKQEGINLTPRSERATADDLFRSYSPRSGKVAPKNNGC